MTFEQRLEGVKNVLEEEDSVGRENSLCKVPDELEKHGGGPSGWGEREEVKTGR